MWSNKTVKQFCSLKASVLRSLFNPQKIKLNNFNSSCRRKTHIKADFEIKKLNNF